MFKNYTNSSLLQAEDSNSSMFFFAEESLAFFDRLAFVRKCEQITGSELTTRTNVLLVRQTLFTPGDGVVFTYSSQKNVKRSHHQGRNRGVTISQLSR